MNVILSEKKPFWVVTHKFAVSYFTEIAKKLKRSWIPLPEPLIYSPIYRNISLAQRSYIVLC